MGFPIDSAKLGNISPKVANSSSSLFQETLLKAKDTSAVAGKANIDENIQESAVLDNILNGALDDVLASDTLASELENSSLGEYLSDLMARKIITDNSK